MPVYTTTNNTRKDWPAGAQGRPLRFRRACFHRTHALSRRLLLTWLPCATRHTRAAPSWQRTSAGTRGTVAQRPARAPATGPRRIRRIDFSPHSFLFSFQVFVEDLSSLVWYPCLEEIFDFAKNYLSFGFAHLCSKFKQPKKQVKFFL
jgi:hypothetical protein